MNEKETYWEERIKEIEIKKSELVWRFTQSELDLKNDFVTKYNELEEKKNDFLKAKEDIKEVVGELKPDNEDNMPNLPEGKPGNE